jgi:opacity protein-like surface antigen
MKKILLFAVFSAIFSFAASAAEQARNLELIDVPTANSMLRGEFRYNVKFYPGGGLLNRIYVGIFDRLVIGGALDVTNIVGTGQIDVVLPPKFLGKLRLTEDDGVMPAIAIGYEGEGYFDSKPRGVYAAVTKEIKMGSAFMQLTGAAYTNEYSSIGSSIDMGAGAAFAITKEFSLDAEYDSILQDSSGHLNFNAGYFFDPIQIDLIFRYGLGEQDIRVARVLRITYISYF